MSTIRPQIQTDQPLGRLHLTDYQGTVHAAMIYDRQPVSDYFRTIDDIAILCTTEPRGAAETAYCILQRAYARATEPFRASD
ncbi:DUF4334 domain-containing protein [Mycobacterium sp. D16R24]|uniref:DUF4334 domain-containing protein n=1 Tax=Mycobacterium sp. D16R24 TaxID=1855656 RepID=UPI000991F2B9|nr:DUF4334 domain-containing protein [Mycobacterium sp. D16R24]